MHLFSFIYILNTVSTFFWNCEHSQNTLLNILRNISVIFLFCTMLE